MPLKGIDVSSWQGDVDWRLVKQEGISFAFIKATEGATYVNPNFSRDWQQSRENGVVRGAYHYFNPKKSAAEQVSNMRNVVGELLPGDLPVVLDLEGDWSAVPINRRMLLVTDWLQQAEQAFGIVPIVYLGFYFARDILVTAGQPDLKRHKLWIANYNQVDQPLIPAPWTTWTFWQYSQSGSVRGIAGNVDLNRCAENDLQILTKK